MARIVRQTIPAPPNHYDREYTARLVDAINKHMFQQAQGESIAARFIATDTPIIGAAPNLPSTATLPTGTFVLKPLPGAPAGTYYLTVVQESDP
jgi:hypothetical protein